MTHAIATGGRDTEMRPEWLAEIDALHAKYHITLIRHGDARGIDRAVDAWAKSRNIPTQPFRPKYGGACFRYMKWKAPLDRNTRMVEASSPGDICLAFPGGGGTADTVRKAEARGLVIEYIGKKRQAEQIALF